MTSFSGFGLKAAAKQALIYAIGVWVLRASGFLLVPLYTRRIDPAHFGIYELLSRTFDILCVVLPAGMGIALMRFYGLAEEQTGGLSPARPSSALPASARSPRLCCGC